MKRILATLFIGCCVMVSLPPAALSRTNNNSVTSLRGRLAAINHQHRTITIEEEFTKLTRTFYVPWNKIDHLKAGDEVRVYSYSGHYEALSVQKMTPVEYRQEDQNKGYLLRAETTED